MSIIRSSREMDILIAKHLRWVLSRVTPTKPWNVLTTAELAAEGKWYVHPPLELLPSNPYPAQLRDTEAQAWEDVPRYSEHVTVSPDLEIVVDMDGIQAKGFMDFMSPGTILDGVCFVFEVWKRKHYVLPARNVKDESEE